MTVLNLADSLRLGSSAVDRLYLGASQVWPPATSPDEFSTTLTVPSGKVASDLTPG